MLYCLPSSWMLFVFALRDATQKILGRLLFFLPLSCRYTQIRMFCLKHPFLTCCHPFLTCYHLPHILPLDLKWQAANTYTYSMTGGMPLWKTKVNVEGGKDAESYKFGSVVEEAPLQGLGCYKCLCFSLAFVMYAITHRWPTCWHMIHHMPQPLNLSAYQHKTVCTVL